MIVLVLLGIGTGWDLYRAAEVRRSGGTEAGPLAIEPAPAVPETPPPPVASSTRPRVDLNRASLAELDALPGIGPVLARRILEHRGDHGRFRSVDELRAVPGIGPALLDRLRERVFADSVADNPDVGRAERMPPPGEPKLLFPSR